jgi:dTDP-4-amino-4,6-dideoxygalactose transaminase
MKKPQKTIPITRPTLEPFSAYAPLFKRTMDSGMLTMNTHGAELEERAAKYLGVKHCVAVSSCTAGLMLVFKYYALKGEVIMPSFTFLASGLPLLWNNLTPVFADIDPDTYCLDPKAVERAVTKKTSAILATHVFGVPCDVKALERVARKHKLKLIYDAAHAFGSGQGSRAVGSFGDAEVFSLSPTKVLTAGEGGIVATNDAKLAKFVREGRNYGDMGGNNVAVGGLSARMPELSAAVALKSFDKLESNLKRRNDMARYLRAGFVAIEPRLKFQHIPKGTRTTYKDFSLYVDPTLGYTRDEMHDYFASVGIMSRKYFHPPLHTMKAYAKAKKGPLSTTSRVSANVLSLPMYAHLHKRDADRIVAAFKDFHDRKKS